MLAFVLFTLTVATASSIVFLRYRETIKREAQHQLGGIAEMKHKQITDWMAERVADARTLREDPLLLAEVDRWLRHGAPAGAARTRLRGRLDTLQRAYEAYGIVSISLFDERAVLRMSSSRDEAPIHGFEKVRLLESMRSGQIEFSDIHREALSSGEVLEIELRIPLTLLRNGMPHAIGAVLFRISPSRFLFPLIQRWPTPSRSAETLLVRRDGDEVIFLNELRHARNIPLAMSLPLSQRQSLAVQAAMGQEGLVEGEDYRGVPVVGVLGKVAGTSWFMVAMMDKAEIYAPVDNLADWIAALMLALVGAGGGLAVYWRHKEKTEYQLELERQALAARLDYLSRHSNDIVLLLNAAGNIVDFNDRALEAYGYSAEEFSGLSINALRAPGLTLSPVRRFGQIDSAGGALLFESTHVRSNGERFPVEISVRRIDIAGERYYQGIHRDITERKKAEDMLRFHSEILKNLAEGVILIRASDALIVFTNPQFERMFGYGHGEMLDKHVSILNAPGEKAPEAVAQEINAELKRKGVWEGELRNIRKDGTAFWCHASISAFEHPQFGKVWVSVHEDITRRKALEKETQERRNEMDELQKLHVAAQTASAIAHELNQPLLAIATYCRAALLMLKSDKPDSGEIYSAIEGSERQAQRAGQAIRQMFDFLTSKEFPLEDFDLNQEIRLMLDDARMGNDLRFSSTLDLEDGLPLVRANRTHVRKALLNLVRNGVEAMRDSGVAIPFVTITVTTSSDENLAQVTIEDNGPGFTKEAIAHLFEPFFTTKPEGFGMGLSISRSLVEMNGGQLWVDPKEGPGAIFHLTIPFAMQRS